MNALFERSGTEFLVNTTTLGTQQQPTITSLASGGFVVSWTDNSGQGGDASGGGIKAQIFDAAGIKSGAEFLVNTATLNSQQQPTITSLASGGFVVSWSDFSGQGADTSSYGIKAQIFDANGVKSGSEFLVNTVTLSNQLDPTVTSLASGGFVVSWIDSSGQGGDASSYGIKAQIFDAAGVKSGAEFLVNTATLNDQLQPTITSLASGGFVVSWTDLSGQGGDASSYGIKAQIFDANGVKSGSEFLVNTATLNVQSQPTITSLASGGFVVSWTDQSGQGGDASGNSIKAQIFDAAGVKSGSEFLVNIATLNSQQQPTITSLASGGFVVSWTDNSLEGGDVSSNGIKAQIFDAAGIKSGPEFLVNTVTLNSQQQPTITSLASGGFVVSWIDNSLEGGDASVNSIKAQIFQPTTGAISDIGISASQVSETAIENFSVATLSATGAVNSSFTYALLNDSSGGAFRIEGDQLIVDDSRKLDFETAPQVSVTIRATDAFGNAYDEVIALDIADVANEVRFSASGEFLVNTATLNEQFEPTITSLASGGFVVSWTDDSGQGGDASGTSIKAQIFDAAGVKSGGEFLVNTATLNSQSQPTITSLASGGFVVSWTDNSGQGGDASGFGIKAQIFTAAGAKSGGEFLVNTATFSEQSLPTITSLASGGFVVSWNDFGGQGGDTSSYSVKAQIFDAAGVKSGGEFLVNTTTPGGQQGQTITSLASGGFVISWTDNSGQGGDASGTSIKAQIFDAAGAKLGTEFLVNTATLDSQLQPTITSLASGGFVVSWIDFSGQGGDASSYGIKAQIFDAAGAKLGAEFLVNTATLNDQVGPTITSLASGGFVVSWVDQSGQGGDASSYGIKAQIFDAAGAKSGVEFVVNTATLDSQEQPTITSLASGAFVVSWIDFSGQGGDASGYGIKAQIFNFVPNNTAPTELTLSATLIDENATTGSLVGIAAATDPDPGDSFTYALLDDAGGRFAIDSVTGAVTVVSAALLNFESAASHNIAARVTDSGGLTFDKAFTITVNDINEAPTINSNGSGATASLSISENETAVTTVVASDPDIAAAIVYSLSGGDDAALFTIDAATGALSFASAPNFEAPADVGGDNVYNVIVRASDGTLFDEQAIAVTVLNDASEIFTGTTGNDTIVGTGDDDILTGLAGNDILNGAGGNDTASYAGAAGAARVSLALATAQNTGVDGRDTLISIENLIGSNFNDVLTGNAVANILDGGAGNDTLIGGAGNDSLLGGLGNDRLDGGLEIDTLDGGAGNDTYTVNETGDVVIEGVNAGTDLVNASASFTLTANVEKLTLTGVGDIDGTGNDLANTLIGNAGNNVLTGGAGKDTIKGQAGNDRIIGGLGADFLTGGTGSDTFVFDSLGTTLDKDTIKDFVSTDDTIEIMRSAFGAFAGDALGVLDASAFTIGTKATTVDHHLIYNAGTGALFYDADGSGLGAQVQIAVFSTKPTLDVTDFLLI